MQRRNVKMVNAHIKGRRGLYNKLVRLQERAERLDDLTKLPRVDQDNLRAANIKRADKVARQSKGMQPVPGVYGPA